MPKKKDQFEKLADIAISGTYLAQAAPMFSPGGRTPTALAGTAGGFVGITVAGVALKTGFKTLKASQRGFKKNIKGKRR